MSSTSKFSYQRLAHEGVFEDEDDYELRERIIGRAKSWSRVKRVHIRRRLKVRVPSLGKFLRRKARLVVVSCARVVKRLKESRAHFGEIFAGNYLFMQVTPTPLKCVDRSLKGTSHDLSYRYSLQKID